MLNFPSKKANGARIDFILVPQYTVTAFKARNFKHPSQTLAMGTSPYVARKESPAGYGEKRKAISTDERKRTLRGKSDNGPGGTHTQTTSPARALRHKYASLPKPFQG